jgi:CHRD domain
MKSWFARLAFAIHLALAPRAWAGDTFAAVLIGANEVPGPGMEEGTFDAVVVVEGTRVSLTLTPKEVGGWMSAHIHRGVAGVAGRLVAEFPWASGDSAPRTYVISVSEKIAADMGASPEKFYVDVHTPGFPAGAARGQLAARSGLPPPAQPPPLAMQVQRMGQPVGGVPVPGARPGWPGGVGAGSPGAAPLPRFQSPSRSKYAFFFRYLAQVDASAADDEAAGLKGNAAERPLRVARAAKLTESEGAILKEVAFECDQALASLDARLRAMSTIGVGPSPEALRLWDERTHLADPYVARLRARLGDAAFTNLDTYIGDHFGGAPDVPGAPGAPGATSPSPKKDQTIDFAEVRTKVYRDSDFRLDARSSSGLRVFFTGTGDCTVYGATVHILSAGRCYVTAHQPGDSRFEAAQDVDQLIKIAKANQRIDGAPAPKTYLDPDFSLPMSATSGLSIVFSAWGDCTVNESYVHITGAGTCSFTAHQPGDSNYLAARIVDQQFTIAKADQTIDFAELPNPYYGIYDLPLRASASSGLPVGFSASGPCRVAGSSLGMLDSGECTVTADQGGDRNFNAAPSVKRAFQIVLPAPTPTPY